MAIALKNHNLTQVQELGFKTNKKERIKEKYLLGWAAQPCSPPLIFSGKA
jgi:hypothetical protein